MSYRHENSVLDQYCEEQISRDCYYKDVKWADKSTTSYDMLDFKSYIKKFVMDISAN